MQRDPNLVPLSHQHQHVLALCVRLERGLQAPPNAAVLESWQAEVAGQFDREMRFHFAAEEAVLFPAASRFDELKLLIQELMVEHGVVRMYARKCRERNLGREGLQALGELLARHVRKEEQQLFEGCQRLLSQDELRMVGAELKLLLGCTEIAAAVTDDPPPRI